MYEIERKILCTLRYRELYIVVLWCLTQKALLILQILYYIRVYLKFFPRTKLMALIMQNFKKKWKYYELLFKPRNIQINRLKIIAHLTPPPSLLMWPPIWSKNKKVPLLHTKRDFFLFHDFTSVKLRRNFFFHMFHTSPKNNVLDYLK